MSVGNIYPCSNCNKLTSQEHICDNCIAQITQEIDERHNQYGCEPCDECNQETYRKVLTDVIKAVESVGSPTYHEAYQGAKKDILTMLKAALERGTISSGLDPMNWWDNETQKEKEED